MIDINLIPKELIPKKRNFLPHLVLAALAVILLSLYGSSMAITYAELGSKESEIQALNADIAKLDYVVARLDELQQQKNLVEAKEKAVHQITSGRTVWSHELHTLASLVPKDMWLEKVELSSRRRPVTVVVPNPKANQKGQPPTLSKVELRSFPALRITGYALSPHRERGVSLVGELIANMKNDEIFSMRFISPEMRTIERKDYRDETVMKFVMDCEIAQ
jgi:Tfp pilus assembly protein PilN